MNDLAFCDQGVPQHCMQMPRVSLRRCVNFVVVVVWLSCLIYVLLGLLLDEDLKSHRNIKDFRPPYVGNGQYGGLTLLDDLGFVLRPRLYPQAYHADTEGLPVFVAAASTENFEEILDFVYSQRLYFPDKKLVVYNMDLSQAQVKQLRPICRCVIRDVRWKHYPEHIQDRQVKAYRPILIQEALMEFGAVFWCDSQIRFKTAEIFTTLNQAERVGVVGWPISYPTSTFTHHGLFRYLNTTGDLYHFHRMVEADALLLYNTETVHKSVMLPWVKCALDPHCISPPGAQPRGCDFSHKPKYIYAGCHRYDTSALNVILGDVYRYETPYIALMDMFDMKSSDKQWSR